MKKRALLAVVASLLLPLSAAALPSDAPATPSPSDTPVPPAEAAEPAGAPAAAPGALSGSAEASARFAIIIGVNQSLDPNTAPLRYADDDAALYLDLFRSLGARSYLLTRPDDNTRRIHPQAAAEALEPTRAEFDRTIGLLKVDLEKARERHVRTIVYFVYAGHGGILDDRAYISLEDARLGSADLEGVVDQLKPDQAHFIVDSCYSYFLAIGRGPGGRRRHVKGFLDRVGGGLASRPGVGLLFSTSSARESHEWEGFQAGVFSHEVRSGLYGAADADGDGQVTYREMVAFIQRANASVPNERFRPDVFAHPATDAGLLVDLREGLKRRIDVKGVQTAHYYLEDTRGVRLADFHNADGQQIRLLRPASAGQLYLRRLSDRFHAPDDEFVIPSSPDVVELAKLEPHPSAILTRGAENDAFSSLFRLPFRREDVETLGLHPTPPPDGDELADDEPPQGLAPWRRYLGASLVGAGLAAGTVGTLTLLSARREKEDILPTTSQADAAAANDAIRRRNTMGGIELGVAGAATLAGLAVLFWPEYSPPPVQPEATAHGATIRFRGTF